MSPLLKAGCIWPYSLDQRSLFSGFCLISSSLQRLISSGVMSSIFSMPSLSPVSSKFDELPFQSAILPLYLSFQARSQLVASAASTLSVR